MKKAFTMIELIIVIVVVGILAAAIIPRMQQDDLGNAAEQVMGHIRYTQHLAMLDDKFIPEGTLSQYTNAIQNPKSVEYWFRGCWQIQFHGAANNYAYSIYSDHPSHTAVNSQYDINPDTTSPNENRNDEIALDPLSGQAIVAFLVSKIDNVENNRYTNVDLMSIYGVETNLETCRFEVGLGAGNAFTTADHIVFDIMGRPHCSETKIDTNNNPVLRLMTQTIKLKLTKDDDNINICIEPYTGYTHICS